MGAKKRARALSKVVDMVAKDAVVSYLESARKNRSPIMCAGYTVYSDEVYYWLGEEIDRIKGEQ